MNTTETLSRTDKELIQMIRTADESSKALLMDALVCIVSFGDDFLKDLAPSIEQENRSQAIATVVKWKKLLNDKAKPAT